jgi:GTP-binding protein
LTPVFADRARIFVAAGAGGDGAGTFRREAHVPRGGPDGGDGGDGGSVRLVVDPGLTTLGDFKRRRHFRAQPGGRGMGRRAHGRNGSDVTIAVPPGTVVRRHPDGEALGELLEAEARLVVARGGRGGRGNVHFATSTHRAPTHFEKGTPGEEGWIELELKLIADIGLVGPPNAGKSTLLAALTAARPEVGDYPFTTITPNLGVIALDEDRERTAVIADLPGLIEGANEGRGLGHHFLRHAERTRVLVGVVDGAAREPLEEWGAVAEELRLHDPALLERPMPIVVTKLDLPAVADRWPELRTSLRGRGIEAVGVSAHDGSGLEELTRRLEAALDEADARASVARPPEAVRVHRFDPLADGWEIVADGDGLRVRGRRVETAAARTDFENAESRDRFWRLLERLGIDVALRDRGAGPGTTVHIGRAELEWGDEE